MNNAGAAQLTAIPALPKAQDTNNLCHGSITFIGLPHSACPDDSAAVSDFLRFNVLGPD